MMITRKADLLILIRFFIQDANLQETGKFIMLLYDNMSFVTPIYQIISTIG